MARIEQTRYELYTTAADGVTDESIWVDATLDVSISDDSADNNFEARLAQGSEVPPKGATLYLDGTDIGGVIEGAGSDSETDEVLVVGRTWSGLLDSRVIEPPHGEDYYTFDTDAQNLVRDVVNRFNLSDFFSVPNGLAGVHITGRFDRYVSVWAGLRKVLKAEGLRLDATWTGARWQLVPVAIEKHIVDALVAKVTSDAGLKPVNHLVCGGKGELKDREIVHLYADTSGNVSYTQTQFGKDERVLFYDDTNAEGDDLRENGIKKLTELQETPEITADFTGAELLAHVGDTIAVVDDEGGTEVSAEVTRVTVQISGGVVTTTVEGGNLNGSNL